MEKLFHYHTLIPNKYTIKSDGFYTGSDFFNSNLFNQHAQSDITYFPLKQNQSPFVNDNFSILNDKTIWTPLADKYTLDYIDGVILIKQSAANVPIKELEY